jgi:hypothetical protein
MLKTSSPGQPFQDDTSLHEEPLTPTQSEPSVNPLIYTMTEIRQSLLVLGNKRDRIVAEHIAGLDKQGRAHPPPLTQTASHNSLSGMTVWRMWQSQSAVVTQS